MMWIKLKKSGMLGKKNAIVQVVEHIGEQRIKDGVAVECDAPKSRRPKINNKAMSAAG